MLLKHDYSDAHFLPTKKEVVFPQILGLVD